MFKWFSIILVIQVTIITSLLSSQPSNALEVSTLSSHIKSNESSQNISDMTNLSTNRGHSEVPKLVASGNNLYAVWLDDSLGRRDIYFRKSEDSGCNFGPVIDISNQNGGSTDPQIASSGNNVYLVWEHTPGNNGAVFFSRSTNAGASFEGPRNIGNNTGFSGFPQIAVSGNHVYLVWHDSTKGILFTRSIDAGASFENVRNIGNKSGSNGFLSSPYLATISMYFG